MTERLSYCNICQVPFTGPAPAQQHYESLKHRRNEEAMKIKTGSGVDKLFNDSFGAQIQQILPKSEGHFPLQNKFTDHVPLPNRLALNAEISNPGMPPLYSDKVDASANSKDCPEQQYYIFNGTRGHCNLCQIDLTSLQHAKQHFSGQKHLKAVRIAEEQKRFYGAAANIQSQKANPEFYDRFSAMNINQNQHPSASLCSYSGSFHGQKADSINLSGNYPVQQSASDERNSMSLSLNLREDSLNTYDLSNKDRSGVDQRSITSIENDRSLGYNFTSNNKQSSVGRFNFLEENLQHPIKPTAENPLPYECSICSKKLNSLEQLILHKNSHASKSISGNSVHSGTDNTIWLPCHHCGKPLNSVKSLRVHLADGHKLSLKEIDDYFVGISKEIKTFPILQKSDVLPNTGQVGGRSSSEFRLESSPQRQIEMEAILAESKRSGFNDLSSNDGKISEDHQLYFNLNNSRVHQDFKSPQLMKSLDDWVPRSLLERKEENFTPIRDMISKGCGKQSCLYHCYICSICLNSDKQRDDHKSGSQHFKKLNGTSGGSGSKADAKYRCELCDASMNTLTDYEKHMKGQPHALNAARKVRAPIRDFGPGIDHKIDFENLTVSKPRSYQVELYDKAIKADAICFLPTGTGKTLVSIMVMSHMLQKYPGRPVVFLVDRQLLVVQQCEEIKKEIGNKLFQRWNESKKLMEERRLSIARLCGGKQDLNENEVWQQDVIVMTAAYYYNLLESESLRWTDNCLVIFDEAHHCVKKHPYKQILEKVRQKHNEHLQLPKILGLTASPAGRNTVKDTLSMLRQLLSEFGRNASLITVEGTNEVTELKAFQSNTELVVVELTHSAQETTFINALRRYIVECWVRLKPHIPFKSGEEWEAQFGDFGMEKSFNEFLQILNSDSASQLCDALDQIYDAVNENSNKRAQNLFLQSHIKYFCQLLVTLETLGMDSAIRDLDYDYIQKKNSFASFQMAAEMNLPCETLQDLVNNYLIQNSSVGATSHADVSDRKEGGGEPLFSVVHKLVSLIVERLDYASMTDDKPLALILVRRRTDATRLAEILTKSGQLIERNMKVACVMGHGSGKDGMTVSQQEKVLTDIREHKYQVIVATSVAEEGLDLPLCELVVQLNPPDTVVALVQIRGRARKKGSQFVAFCQTAEQKNSFDELMRHEEHMIEAVKELMNSSHYQ